MTDEGACCKRGRLCNIYREAWVFWSIVGFARGWFGHFKLQESADDKWLTVGGVDVVKFEWLSQSNWWMGFYICVSS
jgi:hypothetical protein